MKIGTKSVLFGVHNPLWHGAAVWAAYYRLYGKEAFSLPVTVACFIHDMGYWGCAEMDGPEGEEHPRLGARIMHRLFDKPCVFCEVAQDTKGYFVDYRHNFRWHDFALYHSRSMAKKEGATFSKLCVADKLALAMTPRWFYIAVATLTGEIKEYMSAAKNGGYIDQDATRRQWFDWGAAKMGTWAWHNVRNAKSAVKKAA